MLNNFLEVQKQARLEAKRINDSLKLKNKPIYVDPLLFWKNNEIKFIQLSRLAKAFLGIPVTSAYIERYFLVRPVLLCVHIEDAWVTI